MFLKIRLGTLLCQNDQDMFLLAKNYNNMSANDFELNPTGRELGKFLLFLQYSTQRGKFV